MVRNIFNNAVKTIFFVCLILIFTASVFKIYNYARAEENVQANTCDGTTSQCLDKRCPNSPEGYPQWCCTNPSNEACYCRPIYCFNAPAPACNAPCYSYTGEYQKNCRYDSTSMSCDCVEIDSCTSATAPACNGPCPYSESGAVQVCKHNSDTMLCTCTELTSCMDARPPGCGFSCENSTDGYERKCLPFVSSCYCEVPECGKATAPACNVPCPNYEMKDSDGMVLQVVGRKCVPYMDSQFNGCACDYVLCGEANAPLCNGLCLRGPEGGPQPVCRPTLDNSSCECVIKCGDSTAPMCNGQCDDPKQVCRPANNMAGPCECIFKDCEEDALAPQCNGECGDPKYLCRNDEGTCVCKCGGTEVCNGCQICNVITTTLLGGARPIDYQVGMCEKAMFAFCSIDAECTNNPNGKKCSNECKCGCGNDTDCSEGKVCLRTNVCVEPTLGKSCQNDNDCYRCEACKDGICKVNSISSCKFMASCPSGNSCFLAVDSTGDICYCPTCADDYPVCFNTVLCPNRSQQCNYNGIAETCECLDPCESTAPTCNGSCKSLDSLTARGGVCTPHEELDEETGEVNIECRCDDVPCENSSLPRCGGTCTSEDKICAAYKDPVTGEQNNCQCLKLCHENSDCDGNEICEKRLCIPQPANTLCGQARTPQCNGECPRGQSCTYDKSNNQCECFFPCGEHEVEAPACKGACENEEDTCYFCAAKNSCECVKENSFYDDRGNYTPPAQCVPSPNPSSTSTPTSSPSPVPEPAPEGSPEPSPENTPDNSGTE